MCVCVCLFFSNVAVGAFVGVCFLVFLSVFLSFCLLVWVFVCVCVCVCVYFVGVLRPYKCVLVGG